MLDVNSEFLTIGHRGCAGLEPENTLGAVQRAIKLGCPMVEVDVHVVEGSLVVIHDFSVDRTSNGRGSLDKFILSELRKLDVGKGESVPLLEEVFELCMGRVVLNVELKGKGCAEVLATLLKQTEAPELLVSSFDWPQLKLFRHLCNKAEIAVLVDKVKRVEAAVALAKSLKAVAINPSVPILSRELVRSCQSEGFKVYPFTVKSLDDFEKVKAACADGCFADDPRMVLESL
ncbi:glycerophosphodiester phosphodiesterase [Rubritalea spongiae]|uniref:Glycerophosphodiester phosphodiesterase n=1 Tax=Rubritalea spongiae TaxID=430797 RepID=A0ABW5E683_9BACT